jgi:hypothetical protein
MHGDPLPFDEVVDSFSCEFQTTPKATLNSIRIGTPRRTIRRHWKTTSQSEAGSAVGSHLQDPVPMVPGMRKLPAGPPARRRLRRARDGVVIIRIVKLTAAPKATPCNAVLDYGFTTRTARATCRHERVRWRRGNLSRPRPARHRCLRSSRSESAQGVAFHDRRGRCTRFALSIGAAVRDCHAPSGRWNHRRAMIAH